MEQRPDNRLSGVNRKTDILSDIGSSPNHRREAMPQVRLVRNTAARRRRSDPCTARRGLPPRALAYLPFWIFVIVKPLSPLSASNLMVSPTLTCLSIARSLTS